MRLVVVEMKDKSCRPSNKFRDHFYNRISFRSFSGCIGMT